MTSSTRRTPGGKLGPCIAVALAAMAVAAGILGLELHQAATVPASHARPVSNVFVPMHGAAETLVSQMDGLAFAQIADDPTFEHVVHDYYGDRHAAAYRSARPVTGWAGWILAGGGGGKRIAWAMVAISVLSIGTLAFVVAATGVSAGASAQSGLVVLVLPGVLASLRYPGLSEPLAFTLAFGALLLWRRNLRWPAVALFAVAALTRETTLLFCVGLAVEQAWLRRPLRRSIPLAVPVATYGIWCLVVRALVGELPSGSGQLTAPGLGLLHALPQWNAMEWVTAAGLLVSVVAAARFGDLTTRCLLVVHVAFVLCMGQVVWAYWWAFSRVTLPVFILGWLAHGAAAVVRQRPAAAIKAPSPRTDAVPAPGII